jgi:AcrR family transcriptional regulator
MAKPVATRGLARDRVLAAALELFAEHGVSGTSLQMIADRLGISKASVYYQFASKDDIVLAVIMPMFKDLDHVVRIAETVPSPATRREVAIGGLVELVIRHRRTSAVFHGDPVVHHLFEAHEDLKRPVNTLNDLIVGPEPDTATKVSVSMAIAGIYTIVGDPQLAEIDDAELRDIMLACAKRCVAIGD